MHLFLKCACTAFPFHSFRKDPLIQNPRAGKLGLRKEKVLSLRKMLVFRNRNADLFDNELPTPMITCVPTSRAYAHITVYPVWDTKRGKRGRFR